MKFLTFSPSTTELSLTVQLLDLTRVLSKNPLIEIGFSYHSYLSYTENKLYLSTFWERYPRDVQQSMLKAEVYLRAFAQYHTSDNERIQQAIQLANTKTYPKLYKQLLFLFELFRCELECTRHRPGMAKWIQARQDLLAGYAKDRIVYYRSQHKESDAWFYHIQLQMFHNDLVGLECPEWYMVPFLPNVTLESTLDAIRAANRIYQMMIQYIAEDVSSTYLSFEETTEKTFVDLARPATIISIDRDNASKEKQNQTEEQLSMWHRDTDSTDESFLQFEIDQGSSSELIGNHARESDSGDQANAVVEGKRANSRRDVYDQMELKRALHANKDSFPYGESNRYAVLEDAIEVKPTRNHFEQYDTVQQEIRPYVQGLVKSFEKMLEQKTNQPRNDLRIGRLGKQLLRLKIEQYPRLFYKKQQESNRKDAVVSILVDCSSSMIDKMEQVKKGLVLFHSVLKRLQIPHQIAGFWEDGFRAKHEYHPSFVRVSIPYATSNMQLIGPGIMSLQAEEDNRDGFIIRKTVETLRKRTEKQKILLVFTDGEPAAMDYYENGVLDTYQAVKEARKQGVQVIGVFVSNEEIADRDRDSMNQIYGASKILISELKELPVRMLPVLKQLLSQIV